MTVRVRYAPSPTGKVHVGNTRTALMNILFAHAQGGTYVLRFEDTDADRNVDGAEDKMLDDHEWLGIVPDESVRHGGNFGPYRDSERKARGDYQKALDTLFAKNLAYECFVTPDELDLMRKIQTSRGLPPRYDNRHRDLTDEQKAAFRAEGRVPSIRFKMPEGKVVMKDIIRGDIEFETKNLSGDPVIVRSNGWPTFILSGTVNDIYQQITHIIRGEDHISNAATQVLLFEALDATPPHFAHLPMLTDSEGGKLSKRLDSLSIRGLREEGYLPEAIVGYLASLGMGSDAPQPGSVKDFTAKFDLTKISHNAVRFDIEQVQRVNAQAIHAYSYAGIKAQLKAFLPTNTLSDEVLSAFWEAVKPNLTLLSDIKEQFELCFGTVPVRTAPEDKDYIAQALKTLPAGQYTAATWGAWVEGLKVASGRKGKQLFMPLRQALTGQDHGPEMAGLLAVMGETTARSRLQAALQSCC
jgi:glutamyl-tRNA synthetase